MICICYQRQLELLARFAHLPSNAGSGLVVPANVLPSVGALQSSLSNANAALTATPQATLAVPAATLAASPQASAAAALSANPTLTAAAQLCALAGATSGMQASLGIDLKSPSAGAACAEAWAMIPSLMKTLAALPLYVQPKLGELAQVGELSDKLKDQLDVDLAAPDWADALGDSVAEKLAAAQAGAQDALKPGADALQEALASASDAAGKIVPGTPELPATTLAAAESASATTDLLAATVSSVQVGLGVDLSAPGGVEVLGVKLDALKGTLGVLPTDLTPADSGLILATMQMLATIDMLKRTLGIDVLAAGSGASAQSLLDALSASLASAPAACAALDNAAGAASSLSTSAGGGGSTSGGASASLGGSSSSSAGTALGISPAGSSSATASAAALGTSPLANPAVAQMMAGMPGMPVPWLLLTALCAQVKATLGIQLIAHGPCA